MNNVEYLRIEHFGPIQFVELEDIRPFTILIGESGSGKSTIMKVLSMFRWIYKRVVLRSYVRQANIKKTGIGIQWKTLLKTSELDEYYQSNTVIVYRRNDYQIEFSRGKLNARASITPEKLSLEKICYISDKRSMIPDFLHNKMEKRIAGFYLQDTMDNFLSATSEIKSFSLDCLGVDFKVVKTSSGTRYQIHGKNTDEFSINLKNASSGTQTVTPLSLIVEYYARYFDPKKAMDSSLFRYMADVDDLKNFNTAKNIGDIEDKNVHIMIEEPELSLYPESQIALTDFLIHRCFLTAHNYRISLMLATHSPYIVNYLNLVMRRSENSTESSHIKMSGSDINVYIIESGRAIPLKIDGEHTLIDTRTLSDPISEIYKQYNELD